MPDATCSPRDGPRRVSPEKGDPVVAFPRARPARRDAGGNLPVELTSFVGRGREIVEVEKLLANTRLLTLAGPGGCGKTRLALEVARDLADGLESGAWWVGLASLGDPTLVPKSVASALGMREQPGRSQTETLCDHLRSGEMLLVLDNCEHLVEACAALADALLRACPDLRVIATSREPLGIGGETTWTVPSLLLPAAHPPPPVEELPRYEAVRLFVERAAATLPGFAPTAQNAHALVRVCQELDGIPLAIELAAARVRVLTVEQIFERLGDCFGLLTTGSRTALPRQRTLRATIDWSYELLPEAEQALFRRLSVFAGGFALEAAEEVCSREGIEKGEVFDLLSRLVDKSLVTMEERVARARYRLLETIRQYAAEKLEGSGQDGRRPETPAIPGEAEVAGRRHARYFLSLAEEAKPAMVGPDQAAWLGRLEREHDNLRAALGRLRDQGEAERGLRLAGALLRFWWFRGHLTEGRAWLEALLELPATSVRDEVRAKALRALGVLIYLHTDHAAGGWEVARSRLEESLEIYRRLGNEQGAASVLQNLARVNAELGEWAAALSLVDENLEIARRSENRRGMAQSLFTLGLAHLAGGELAPARAHLEDCIGIFRELDDKFWINACLVYLGYVDCEEGEYAAARSRFVQMHETLPLAQFPWGATYTLDGFARLAAAEGQAARALKLGGATVALRRTFGVSVGPAGEAAFERSLEPAWRALSEQEGKAAWEEGRAMTLEGALALALEEPETEPDHPRGNLLSARETEVLSLVAEGLSDAEVAERLYVSHRTVGHHLRSVYRKLDVSSRTAAVKSAGELGWI